MTQSALSTIPLFAELDEPELDVVLSRSVTRNYPKNSILINEGDQTDSLYVLLEGRVKVFTGDEDGKELLIRILEPGEYFGELAVIDEEPRSASVMTMESSRLVIISKTDFMQCLTKYPTIAVNLLRVLARRLRTQTETTKTLALMGVYERVAKMLLSNAVEQEGMLVVEDMTQKQLATMVGASREMISLVLKELKTGGYIVVQRGKITIKRKLPAKW